MKVLLRMLILAACPLLLYRCDNSFNPNGPYQERLVVYGVFSTHSDTQYVRLYTTYPSTGQAANPNVSGAVVTVAQGSTQFQFRDTTLHVVDPAAISHDIKAFVAYGLPLNPGAHYELSVVSPSRPVARAQATGLSPGRMFTELNSRNDINVQVTSGSLTSAYIVRMYIEYEVRVDSVRLTKRIEVPGLITADGESIYPKPVPAYLGTITFPASAYSSAVGIIRSEGPRGTHLTKTIFVLTELDQSMYAYYSTANGFPDTGTLRLDEPDYSNIQGGLGVFGMTAETVFEADSTGNSTP